MSQNKIQEVNLCDLWARQNLLRYNIKNPSDQKILDKLHLTTSVFQKMPLRKCKDNPQNGRKCQHIVYLTKNLYTNYEVVLQLNKKKAIQFLNGQRNCINISQKKRYEWPINTGKDAPNHYLPVKCKSKSQCDTNSHLLGWT